MQDFSGLIKMGHSLWGTPKMRKKNCGLLYSWPLRFLSLFLSPALLSDLLDAFVLTGRNNFVKVRSTADHSGEELLDFACWCRNLAPGSAE